MLTIVSTYKYLEKEITSSIKNFTTSGELLVAGKRNTLKLFVVNEVLTLNIKSFKKPVLWNQIAYGYFRKSKAKRSFEYANILLEKGIGTPKPIAFKENSSILGLLDSYYVSEHLNADLTYRELVEIEDYPNKEEILRQFTRFSYRLHQKGIEFKDHSPGNTLIKKHENNQYSFYLVDLNRMKFHNQMTFQMRMKNLCRLTPHKEMVEIMSNEYAKISGENEQTIFETLWKLTADFQYRYYRKKRIKKKLKFWK